MVDPSWSSIVIADLPIGLSLYIFINWHNFMSFFLPLGSFSWGIDYNLYFSILGYGQLMFLFFLQGYYSV